MKIFLNIVSRDLKLHLLKGSGNLSIFAFFLIIATLFSFAVDAQSQVLTKIAAGIIWVCAILTCTLSLPKIFEDDFEDGSLTQLMMQQTLPEIVILAKILSHWLATGVPLVFISPIVAIMLDFPIDKIMYLVISLLIGTANLSLIGALGASLILGLKKNSGIISVLVLPLSIPTLIFGIYSTQNINNEFLNNFAIMVALFLILLPVSIIATSKSVQIAIED